MKTLPRERLLQALSFQQVDVIPVMGSYAGALGQFGGPFLEDETIPAEKREQLQREMESNPPAASVFQYDPDIYRNGWDQWGVLWDKILDVVHPIGEWDDLQQYQFPEVQPDGFPEAEIAACRRAGKTVVFGGAWQIITFERYRTLRGFENCMTDPILYPDNCFDLISRIEQYNLRLIQRWIELGCEIVGFADDLGSMRQTLISPETWREFYKPSYKHYCQLIHDAGAKTWMHSDGGITAIIPDLIEVGLDILDPVQAECIDINQLAKEYGGQLVIWGGLDSHAIGRGTYETVRRHTWGVIDTFQGFSGGMVGTRSNYLLPSIDVALALYHAFRNAP